MKTLIIEDEKTAQQILEAMLASHCPEVEIVGTADSIESAIQSIELLKPDLVFIDVELRNTNSFKILEQLSNIDFAIIFTTAHNEYALKAIKYAALDYLLKPIDIDELKSAVAKVEKRKKTDNIDHIKAFLHNLNEAQVKKITISTAQEILYIELNEIVRCEADGGYTHFYLTDKKKITTTRSLGDYEALLLPENFLRIHHAHLVNIKHVKRFIKSSESLLMSDESNPPVSFRRKSEILNRLSDFNMPGKV